MKAYAAAGQALLLIPVLRAHGAIAQRVSRLKLIAIIFFFVASNLLVFAALLRAAVPSGCRSISGSAPSIICWSPRSGASRTTSTRPSKESGCSPSSVSAAPWGARRRRAGELPAQAPRSAAPDARLGGLLVVTVVPFAGCQRRKQCRPQGPRAGGREGSAPERCRRLPGPARRPVSAPHRLITVLANWVTNSGEYVLDKTLIEVARSGASGRPRPVRRPVQGAVLLVGQSPGGVRAVLRRLPGAQVPGRGTALLVLPARVDGWGAGHRPPPGARSHPGREGGGEGHRVFARDHRGERPLPGRLPRREVQGQGGDRHLPRPRRATSARRGRSGSAPISASVPTASRP